MNSKHGSGSDGEFSHTPTRHGQAPTDLRPNPTTGRIAVICQGYNELPLGAPLMVVRHAKPSHSQAGGRRETQRPITPSPSAIILAVKPASSGPGRMAPEGVVLPVTKYAERASGRNTVVEKSIVITPAEIQSQLVEVHCGETPIYGWIFSQSGQKPVVTWLTSEQVLTRTVCHLAANIEYKFGTLERENTAINEAIVAKLKSLAEFATIKPRTGNVMDRAREIVEQLQLIGLEEATTFGALAVAIQEMVREFVVALLGKQQG